ncbi:MAG: type II toxin-antitoxin system RelE/ParE family toxin [Albidovulum sp.]|nr:type II toxin-antitoxin system RelE/ParE family toxin [Albidovulum sp.]
MSLDPSDIASVHRGAEKHEHVLDFIFRCPHPAAMSWRVQIAEEFEPEFFALQSEVQDAILTMTRLLRQFGPQLGRPQVDTLNGSRHANMKELRLSAAGGEWRIAFAFDPVRRAMLLVAGDKSGGSGRRFYRELIRKADERFDRHLARLAEG